MKSIKLNSFRDLIVWQKATDISVEVYRITSAFPSSEIFGLTSQIRRASNSISMNIAEGYTRNSSKSYLYFLNVAQGSLSELESAVYLAERLSFIKAENLLVLNTMITEEHKMLYSLIEKIKQRSIPN